MRPSIVTRLLAGLALALVALEPEPGRAQGPAPALFDTHIHYNAPAWTAYPPERVLEILRKAGIARALVSSTPDDGTLALYRKDPARVVPILRPYRVPEDAGRWWHDPSVLAYLEERLASHPGIHKGIGEFHLFGGQTKTPVVRGLAALAVRQGLYLHAHSDERAIVELFSIEPRLRIIWAHAGMTTRPRTVGALLDRYPSLWVDLSYRNDDVAPGGRLDPAWRALFLRHPDRFMVGTDTWATERWESLPSSVAEVRRYLAELPSEVGLAIAFGNAERLFP